MRVKRDVIKVLLLLLLIGALLGFTIKRNDDRKIMLGTIEFTGDENHYITHDAVNKLLIQNGVDTTGTSKETIDLNELEKALNSNKMIQEAQVFITVNGRLEAKIEQRTPTARVIVGDRHFYIDDQGKEMPLSPYYSARVPIVRGADSPKAMQEVYQMAKAVQQNDFMRQNVVGITFNDGLELQMRDRDLVVLFGKAEQFDEKVNKLKAFYKKGLKDNALNSYRTVNLKYNKQVVCTKK